MKKVLFLLTAMLAFAACEDVLTEDPNAVPKASDYEAVITVDNATNEVTFTINPSTGGVVPAWYFQDNAGEYTKIKTGNGYKEVFKKKGTYNVRMYVTNRNGQSADYKQASFEIVNELGAAIEGDWKGFDYDNAANIWKAVDEDANRTYSYYYAPGWSQLDNPKMTNDGNAYTLVLPEATTDQWQAQFFIIPSEGKPLHLDASKNYDFSVVVETNNELPGMTFKLTDITSDGNFLFANQVKIEAGAHVYHLLDLPGIDADVKMVFDFGGNPAGTEVTVSRIVIKDHSVDDGTNPPAVQEPEPGPEPEPEPVRDPAAYYPDADTNLLKGVTPEVTQWFSAADWSGALTAEYTLLDRGFEITIPEGIGGAEWMGQFALHTNIPASAAKTYDTYCKVECATDAVITVKVTNDPEDDDFVLFYANDVNVPGEVDFPDRAPKADVTNLMIIFDFGRVPAGTVIKVSDLCFQEHISAAASGAASQHGELWATATITPDTWFSPSNWSGGLDPKLEMVGQGFKLTTPEGIGGAEWQGQVKLAADFPLYAANKYDVACKIKSTLAGTATIKLSSVVDDANHQALYDNGIAVGEGETVEKSYTECVPDSNYDNAMLIFDFGRFPAGAVIEVSDITITVHE